MQTPIIKRYSYRKLDAILIRLGYKSHKTPEGYMIYKHVKSGSLVGFHWPHANQIVPVIITGSVLRSAINFGVATEKKINAIEKEVSLSSARRVSVTA
jgi:hypothetical protein